MATSTSAEQVVQQWGNGLTVRLTAKIAKAAHLALGQPVRVDVVKDGVLLRPALGLPWSRRSSSSILPNMAVRRGIATACSLTRFSIVPAMAASH